MKAPPYNPADHGFAAKVWECLRRNEAFRNYLMQLRERRHEFSYMQTEFRQNCSVNFLVAFIVTEIFGYYVNGNLEILNVPWPLLHDDGFRDHISRIVDPSYGPMPRVIDSLAVSDQNNPFDERLSWRTLSKGHNIVAIPRVVRDSEHRKKILEYLGHLVSKAPVKRISFRDNLPSGGKMFGTRKDWEMFLFVEALRQRKPPRSSPELTLEDALKFAAWRFYEAETFDESKIFSAEGRQTARRMYVRRGEKVRNHMAPIENGIATVYPRFAVF